MYKQILFSSFNLVTINKLLVISWRFNKALFLSLMVFKNILCLFLLSFYYTISLTYFVSFLSSYLYMYFISAAPEVVLWWLWWVLPEVVLICRLLMDNYEDLAWLWLWLLLSVGMFLLLHCLILIDFRFPRISS